ncbi:cation:proton antiporter [Kitasatospora sp. NPDC001660]
MTALLQAAAIVAVVLVAAHLARGTAVLFRQPPVVGEIAVGLVVVPLLTAVAGPRVAAAVLPGPVTAHLHTIGVAGLALYLAGIGHGVQPRPGEVTRRSYTWLLVASLVPGLGAGALLAWWVVWRDDAGERGGAPAAALVLMLAAALAVTAVPVLVRILADRGLLDSQEGRLSVLTAVSIDAVTWVVLAAALVAASGGGRRLVDTVVVLVLGAVAAVAARAALRHRAVTALCRRWPAVAAVLLGAAAVGAALGTERAGLTAIYGAVLVGLAVPRGGERDVWSRPVERVTALGLLLVPVFFVTTGFTISTHGLAGFSWATLAVVLVLGAVTKVGGGWAGARAAGLSHGTALRFGVLMNTRGLTEMAVLQAGLSAGILTPGLFLTVALMALLATVGAGPALELLERWRFVGVARPGAAPRGAPSLPESTKELLPDDHA